MLLRWSCCVLLILLLVDIEKTQCKSYTSSSRSSGSRGSSSSSSLGSSHSSFGSGSRPSHSSFGSGSSHSSFGSGPSHSSFGSGSSHSSFGSGSSHSSFGSGSAHSAFGSGSSHNSGSASHGSYGWKVTTSRPITHPTPRRTTYHPITTLPTRRTTHHVITTLPTRRTTHHVITTLPTRKTTHHVITTLPTAKTTHTRQPPFNPNFTPPPKQNYSSGSNHGSTKQPPYNPFLSSSTSNHGTTKQPPFNPFFSSSASNLGVTKKTTPNPFFTTSSHKNNSSIYTKQPPFNPNFTPAPAVTPKYNGTNSNIWGHTTSHPNTRPSNNGSIWGNTPKPYHNNSVGVITPKPPTLQTTKIIPVGGGNNGRQNYTWPTQPSRPSNNYTWGNTPKRPTFTTHKPIYVGPSYNTSINNGNGKPGVSTGIYQPPIRRNNTFTTGSAIHPVQPVIHPTQGHPSTTIINNNNHYYGGSGYYQPGHYTSPGSGPTHVTIINNNNYNTNHHVIVPSRHYYSYGPPAIGISVNTNYYDHFPVRYHTTYHYSSYDTGNSALGFFLGYELGRITRPSYYYHSTSYVNNEYIPRYDHYTVHHYYHNSASIPKESPIQPNAVVVCAGDSGILCPPGTMPLCTNNGAVMCVVNSVTAKPCSDNKQLNCFTSTISCEGNPSAECKQKSSASVSMPCVSTASIPAGVSFVNNSVIVTDTNDSTVKSFCVTVLALPTKNETNSTNSQQSPVDIYVPYRYTTNDTGVDLLGYYLGYKLQNLVEPSYSYLNYDQNYNYIDKFNHYNVFHYYHDANILSKDVDVKKEQIMNCAGDSGTFCPQFTVSLCLNDGAVICAADLSSTTFNDQLQTKYLNSSISCEQLQSPVCLSNPNLTIPIQIPCISTAKVYADISYMIRNYGTGNNTQYYRTVEVSNVTSEVQNSTVQRELCVTILALPGEKIKTDVPAKRKVTGVPNDTGYLSLPKYTYTSNDTGTSIFGAYLIYRLGKLKFPTYYFMNAFLYAQNGVIQKYDHYSVHYHSRGKEIVPDFLEFQAFDLRACEGDSGLICPGNTSVICLNDGAVMCLTDLLATVPCVKANNTVCAKATVTCEKNNPCIKGGTKKVILPCISTATIYGDIMSVNNNIYKISPAAARVYTDIQPIPGTNVNNTPVYHKAQQFCVSLVTLPAERAISEGEKLADNSDAVFGKILSGLFGNW